MLDVEKFHIHSHHQQDDSCDSLHTDETDSPLFIAHIVGDMHIPKPVYLIAVYQRHF